MTSLVYVGFDTGLFRGALEEPEGSDKLSVLGKDSRVRCNSMLYNQRHVAKEQSGSSLQSVLKATYPS
jgi:hypothetical protein